MPAAFSKIFLRLRAWWGRLSSKKKIALVVGVVVLGLIIVSSFGKKDGSSGYELVTRQDLARTVRATGVVTSATDLALSFEKAGVVRSINVAVGERVVSGQTLASLDSRKERSEVTKARGALLAAEANYRKVLEGERAEEVRVAEVAVENARRKLYSSDLEAVPEYEDTATSPVVSGTYTGTTPGSYRISFGYSTNQIEFSGLERGTAQVSETAKPFGTLGLRIAFPDSGYGFGEEWVIAIPNKEGANYTANVNALEVAEAELSLARAKSRSADVDAALAEVLTAQGSLEAAEAELAQTVLRAPAPGTITKVDVAIGEVAEAFKGALVLQDVSNLYLEANVNESNVAYLSVGQPVAVTYDAFGNEAYAATLSSVDPAATVVDGVVNYKVKALIPAKDTVRPGMTANLSIQTAFVPGALVVPSRAITTRGEEHVVLVLVDERRGTTEERVITTGLSGDGGLVEVVSGLVEGARVVLAREK